MEHRIENIVVCLELKNRASNDPSLMKPIITGDKTWAYRYISETKAQSPQRKTANLPRSKNCFQVRSNIKAMHINLFFYFFFFV